MWTKPRMSMLKQSYDRRELYWVNAPSKCEESKKNEKQKFRSTTKWKASATKAKAKHRHQQHTHTHTRYSVFKTHLAHWDSYYTYSSYWILYNVREAVHWIPPKKKQLKKESNWTKWCKFHVAHCVFVCWVAMQCKSFECNMVRKWSWSSVGLKCIIYITCNACESKMYWE